MIFKFQESQRTDEKTFKKLAVSVKYEVNVQKVANIHATCAKQSDQYMCILWSEIDLTD